MRITKSSMRVATLVSSISRQAGGLFQSVRSLTLAVCQGGVDTSVFSLRDRFTEVDRQAWNGAALTVCDVRGLAGFGFSPDLKRKLCQWSAEIVHLHGLWMYPSVVALRAVERYGVRSVVSPCGMLDPWALNNSGWKKKTAGWLFENRNLRSASCIHALCESEYRSIRAYGLKNPVCIVPNGVDLPQDGPKLAPPWAEMARPGRKVILFLGRIHPKKGLSNLIQAWSRLRQSSGGIVSEWAIVIAGWSQNGHEAELRKMVHEKGLTPDIIFMGPVFDDKKKACLQNADAFVLPSFSEGLPMSILEAWSYSLPVVMTRECNIPEGFEAGAAVEVLPDVDSVADGLRSFFSLSAAEQKNMGLRGRNLVEAQFSWPQIAVQMIQVYRWVLGQGPRPDCVRLN